MLCMLCMVYIWKYTHAVLACFLAHAPIADLRNNKKNCRYACSIYYSKIPVHLYSSRGMYQKARQYDNINILSITDTSLQGFVQIFTHFSYQTWCIILHSKIFTFFSWTSLHICYQCKFHKNSFFTHIHIHASYTLCAIIIIVSVIYCTKKTYGTAPLIHPSYFLITTSIGSIGGLRYCTSLSSWQPSSIIFSLDMVKFTFLILGNLSGS